MSNNTTVKCQNCKEVFKVDDAIYNNIVKQVRDQQFDEEIGNRLTIAKKEKQNAIEIAESKVKVHEKLQKENFKKTLWN